MSGVDPDRVTSAQPHERTLPSGPRRHQARLTVSLTEREVRAIVRATALVADVLRPELVRQTGSAPQSPLVTAHQALIAACERQGVELGLGRPQPPDQL